MGGPRKCPANAPTASLAATVGTERCVVCLMSRREFDDTGQTCSREYRSGVEFHLPPKDPDKADE
jgi:hypothetical protein